MFKLLKLIVVLSVFVISTTTQAHAAEKAPLILFTADRDSGPGIFRIDVGGKNLTQLANDIPSGSYAAPAWSPDGKQIAYLSRRDGSPQIYLIDAADGGNTKRVTSQDILEVFTFSWSSTGEFAFLGRSDKGQTNLYLINTDGKEQKQILAGFDGYYSIAFSPDGKQIAFPDFEGIQVINTDGTGKQKINKDKEASYWSVHWSPDGKALLVGGVRSGKQGVYSIDVQSGVAKQIISDQALNPIWSPDGKAIAFRPSDGSISMVDASGKNRKQVTNDASAQFAWSPDGKQIVFVSYRSQNDQIYSMALDGSDLKKISTSIGNYSPAQLSPDGTKIVAAFVGDGKKNSQIVVMNADGSEQKQLTKDDKVSYFRYPVWTPDGKHILFTSTGTPTSKEYVIDPDGKNQKQFLSGVSYSPNLRFSPDGKQIIYIGQGINIVRADGKSPRLIFKEYVSVVRWSSDGKQIAFIGGNQQKLQVVNIDGSNLRSLSENSALDFAWSPDGTQIAYRNYQAILVISLSDTERPKTIASAPTGTSLISTGRNLLWPTPNELVYIGDSNGNAEIFSVTISDQKITNLTQSPAAESWIGIAP